MGEHLILLPNTVTREKYSKAVGAQTPIAQSKSRDFDPNYVPVEIGASVPRRETCNFGGCTVAPVVNDDGFPFGERHVVPVYDARKSFPQDYGMENEMEPEQVLVGYTLCPDTIHGRNNARGIDPTRQTLIRTKDQGEDILLVQSIFPDTDTLVLLKGMLEKQGKGNQKSSNRTSPQKKGVISKHAR
ncbi:hypothetical protein HGA88_04070 [Candidatus Roizmanbacteria bacterium]|nr:hypothetical protein [Candidatus Roizmanbacteria bacterium]